MGRKQYALGLHLLPVANVGRMSRGLWARHIPPLRSSRPGHAGAARDSHWVGGTVGHQCAVRVARVRADVSTAVSAAPEFFNDSDLGYLATVAGG